MQQVKDLERIFNETEIFRKKANKQTKATKNLHKLRGARGLRTAARFGSVDGILDEVAIAEYDSLQQ